MSKRYILRYLIPIGSVWNVLNHQLPIILEDYAGAHYVQDATTVMQRVNVIRGSDKLKFVNVTCISCNLLYNKRVLWVGFMVFNATLNNISVIW